MSETISSLAEAHERLDWPREVVCAMRALQAQAERVQAVVDAASVSGSKIGRLAATLEGEAAGAYHRDAVSELDPLRAPARGLHRAIARTAAAAT